ncbi:MAG: transcription-repair coupling factor [Deltaproteobacteria bacterium]|nr:transcription-repair coupling factor [Deltaproteobacteria bacterium]
MTDAATDSSPPAIRDLAEVAARVCARSGTVRLTGLRGSARAAVVSELIRAHADRAVVCLVPTSKSGDALLDDLRSMLGEAGAERLRAFPRHDTPPFDRFSPQPFVLAQRMDVLYRLLVAAGPRESVAARKPAPIVVAPWTALATRVPSREVVRARSVELTVGQSVDRDALAETLIAAGYTRMSLVEERGELSVRGGILDVFPPQRSRPVRIELLGDEVESIREFDAASQRSQERLASVVCAPPRELLFDRETVIERSDAIRALGEAERIPPRHVDETIDALLRGSIPPGAEALAPLLQPGLETFLDFLPDDALVVIDDDAAGRERLVRYAAEAFGSHDVARAGGRLACAPDQVLVSPEALAADVAARRPVHLERLDVAEGAGAAERYNVRAYGHDALRRELVKARTSEQALGPLVDRLAEWVAQRWRVTLAAPVLSGAERLRELLATYEVPAHLAIDARPVARWSAPGRIEVRVATVSEGFSLPIERLAVVTEEEIFGPRERHRAARLSLMESAAIEGLGQLAPGDPLVHAEHGIGIYRGLVPLELGGASGEFLRLEYEGGDRLFVPVHRLNLVQRYVGADGHAPRLDRLGGSTWEKAKRSVRRSIRDMAKELLALHAARELAEGHAYAPRDRHLEEFEAAFPHEETPDQLAAIEDVLADLQRPRPMDRLVCGDVGYGKTEVAVRAAFRVVMEGRQVAVLVPTTILAQQHEETFRKRFEGYPVRIESLSRFRSAKDSKAVLAGLRDGTLDIVIGTHRLLQKSVEFRHLGLLVIDEEHRFGVAHKERLKQIKKTVDVLTLTATPIPRTLQMAFTGIRDLSVIQTPPADRLSIRTQVCRFTDSLIREAILREVRRGGQVFFVHNRVHGIDEMAEHLRRIVPEVKLLVAHGQMNEHELEKRMLAFMHGESDVLLCTTIVESGLDIPRANTILVNRADALGLAQLYQLRGRVGRSAHRAYAYLLVRSEAGLTADAARRLEAIQDLAELGSGFRLASMDLEIRGAGNLLGAEQSGNLAALGYDTYMQMLEEAVAELRGQPHETEVDPEIRLPVAAKLPEDFVPDVSQRLVLYKRLASSREDGDVDRIRDEILDRYGRLPPQAENLLHVIRLKILARRLGVASVDLVRGELVLTAGPATRIDPQRLVRHVLGGGAKLRVTPDHRIHAPAPAGGDPRTLFEAARALLASLDGDPHAASGGAPAERSSS